jgi:elongation factor P
MLTTGDFKRGLRVLLDGAPYTIEDFSVQTPSARGAATLFRARFRNMISGQVLDRTFEAGEKFEEPDVKLSQVQFLYTDGESCHFMDTQTYEQFTLSTDTLADAVPWLTEGLQVSAVVFNGRAVGINLPPFVEAEVELVGAGSRQDTASGKNLKEAKLTNGETVRVPLFIEPGERILVDTRTWEFAKRAQK